jgi:hypothetical protein
MSYLARTIWIYSFYLFMMGACLIFAPNLILGMFGFQHTTEIWIRLLGLFTFTAGIYYFQCSRYEQTEFFKATIIGRMFFFLMTILFVFVLAQSPMLAAIGVVDFVGALWSWHAFKTNPESITSQN